METEYKFGAADLGFLLLALPSILIGIALGAVFLLIAIVNMAAAVPFLIVRMAWVSIFSEIGEEEGESAPSAISHRPSSIDHPSSSSEGGKAE